MNKRPDTQADSGQTNATMPVEEQARREITAGQLRKFAKLYHGQRELAEIAANRTRPPYRDALENYHAVLWRFVMDMTPDSVRAELRRARLNPLDTCEALFYLAVYKAGMRTDEKYNPKHAQQLNWMWPIADKLNDEDFFEKNRQHHHNKPKEPVQAKLKYCLLVSWLVAGLWRMGKPEHQHAALKKLWPKLPARSDEAVKMAANRLGLKTFLT